MVKGGQLVRLLRNVVVFDTANQDLYLLLFSYSLICLIEGEATKKRGSVGQKSN